MKIVAVVLAGGLGVRLWPRSTERKPKQFVHVLGEGTLIQNTVSRLAPFVHAHDTYVVSTPDFRDLVSDQLPSLQDHQILSEPFGRNTGPAIGFAATKLRAELGDDVVMVVLPSDHLISNVREFHVLLDKACSAAIALERIITIGVMPTRAETGYGYIQVGDDIPTDNPVLRGVVKAVETFAEKPDSSTAQRFVDAGDFAWNSGIVVGTVATILDRIAEYLPDHAPLLAQYERAVGSAEEYSVLENMYRQMRSVSFDVGVLERDPTIGVVEGTFGWSDVGTWDELYRMSMKDGKNNVLEGNVLAVNTTNCLVSGSTGRLIGVINADNLVVVETESSILISKRGRTEDVRDLVDQLRRRHIAKHF
jgi:mannose-1-phosphate guanylyltransferase